MKKDCIDIKTKKFEINRIFFDKSVWTVYFRSIVKNADKNGFDPDLADFHDLEDKIVKSSFGKGSENVLEIRKGIEDKPSLRGELRLRKTRSLRVFFNFNRYFLERDHVPHVRSTTIRDNNYLPMDTKVEDKDYVELYKSMPEILTDIYEKWYAKLWPESFTQIKENNETPIVKCSLLEFGKEMLPLSTKDVEPILRWNGQKYSRFYDPSGTIYINDDIKIKESDFEECLVDDMVKLKVPKEQTITLTVKQPYSGLHKIKMYNKSISNKGILMRFEVTTTGDEVVQPEDLELSNLYETLRIEMEETGMFKPSEKVENTQILKSLCKAYRIDRETLHWLAQCGETWESTEKNRILTNRLIRRGILQKIHRGLYKITPLLKDAMKKAKVVKVGNQTNRLDSVLPPKDLNEVEYEPRLETKFLSVLKLDEKTRESAKLGCYIQEENVEKSINE